MKNKILIIGQAPPAIEQKHPYDTTMLYEMLSWVGIGKIEAQEIFEFDAVSDKFPGYGKTGHNKPSQEDMINHWLDQLSGKFNSAEKVILLGKVASEFVNTTIKLTGQSAKIIELPHPSRRNYNLIMKSKEEITKKLNFILQ